MRALQGGAKLALLDAIELIDAGAALLGPVIPNGGFSALYGLRQKRV